jgi:hypothetical protein
MGNTTDLRAVFETLKKIFAPYEKKMDVAQDTPNVYRLNARYIMKNKQPLNFGGVRLGKNYVSFYLMSLYTSADGIKTISPDLKKRMQGKSCFNFKTVDEKLFKELANLTKTGAKQFTNDEFVDRLRKLQNSSAAR